MPKTLHIDPDTTRRAGELAFPRIPLHAPAPTLADERARRGDATLFRVLRHMLLVREFESMLASFKAKGAYGDIRYAYKGPAHLSVGQEAAAVGAALALRSADHIFGSHRSHGEFIAKGLAAISSLDDDALDRLMRHHAGGALLATVERHLPADSISAIAEHFLLFGLLAEIFMRENGFNGGMGGSMHAFFPPFGAYPNNAIVGASAGIAAGSALYEKIHGDIAAPRIAVAMIGDGSTGCGPVYEAMNFAGMAQYRTLWPRANDPDPSDLRPGGGLPVLFLFSNNFYAMGGQTAGETMAWDRLSRIGAGINAEAMHAETVDGTQPLAVAAAVERRRELLLSGRGPALLDVECYRASGHSASDANAYRTREELSAWQAHDPVAGYAATLVEAGITTEDEVTRAAEAAAATIAAVTHAAVDPEVAPVIDVASRPNRIGERMFADTEQSMPQDEALPGIEGLARLRQHAKKARFGLDGDGKPLSPLRAITLRDGLFEAIVHHLHHDPTLSAWGEECREWGGAFGVYRGLSDAFAHERLFNAPISEGTIVAAAVGYAMEGGRALVELMYADFIGRAGDEIFNQLAKWRAMSNGELTLPVVLRCSVGSKYGAQHSQDWSALVAHVPGLKVVYPATPYDAKGLMAAALASDDPVVFFESQRLYDTVEQFAPDGVPADYYRLPLGVPDLKRSGTDVTVLSIGPSLHPALAAAEMLDAEHAISVEVVDARSLVPFDYAPLLASVRKTGRLLIVSEASERGSMAMTFSASVARLAFDALRAPPRVLGAPNWIVPGADLESSYFPGAEDIADVVLHELMEVAGAPRRGKRDPSLQSLALRGI